MYTYIYMILYKRTERQDIHVYRMSHNLCPLGFFPKYSRYAYHWIRLDVSFHMIPLFIRQVLCSLSKLRKRGNSINNTGCLKKVEYLGKSILYDLTKIGFWAPHGSFTMPHSRF